MLVATPIFLMQPLTQFPLWSCINPPAPTLSGFPMEEPSEFSLNHPSAGLCQRIGMAEYQWFPDTKEVFRRQLDARFMEISIQRNVFKHHFVPMLPQTPHSKQELSAPREAVGLKLATALTFSLQPLRKIEVVKV